MNNVKDSQRQNETKDTKSEQSNLEDLLESKKKDISEEQQILKEDNTIASNKDYGNHDTSSSENTTSPKKKTSNNNPLQNTLADSKVQQETKTCQQKIISWFKADFENFEACDEMGKRYEE